MTSGKSRRWQSLLCPNTRCLYMPDRVSMDPKAIALSSSLEGGETDPPLDRHSTVLQSTTHRVMVICTYIVWPRLSTKLNKRVESTIPFIEPIDCLRQWRHCGWSVDSHSLARCHFDHSLNYIQVNCLNWLHLRQNFSDSTLKWQLSIQKVVRVSVMAHVLNSMNSLNKLISINLGLSRGWLKQ